MKVLVLIGSRRGKWLIAAKPLTACASASYDARADRVRDQMDRPAHRRLLVEQGQQFAELARAMPETDHATHLAIADTEASQQVNAAVALVLELASRRPTRAGGQSGAVGWRTPIAGFSSTHNSGPSVGGLSSGSMSQILDAPVGLPGPRRIDLGGFRQANTRSRAWMSAW
jgi:hypothetical protein